MICEEVDSVTVLRSLYEEGGSGPVEKSWCMEADVEEERVVFLAYLGSEQPAGCQGLS
jgi:hypothetical protein